MSGGAYSPGQEDAPAAMRDAGLAALLEEYGIAVTDLGDIPRLRWRPDPAEPFAMNVAAVHAAVLAVADRVADTLGRGLLPVVLGGDCTVELGTVLGHRRHAGPAPLVYVDPHPDCNTPETVPDGALDWMGVAHMLGLPGTRPELAGLGPGKPLLAPADLLLLASSPARSTPAEQAVIAEHRIERVAEDDVARDPAAAARHALGWVGARGAFLVHLDADTIDLADLPLAENTDRNVGLRFDTVAAALDVLLAALGLAALTATEVNPHHGLPGGETIRAFAERLAGALGRA